LPWNAAVRERLLQSNPCGKHHRLPRLPEHDPTILTILTVVQVEVLVTHLRNGAPPRGKDRSGAQPIRPNPSLAGPKLNSPHSPWQGPAASPIRSPP
jgi:hypothetical protein